MCCKLYIDFCTNTTELELTTEYIMNDLLVYNILMLLTYFNSYLIQITIKNT